MIGTVVADSATGHRRRLPEQLEKSFDALAASVTLARRIADTKPEREGRERLACVVQRHDIGELARLREPDRGRGQFAEGLGQRGKDREHAIDAEDCEESQE